MTYFGVNYYLAGLHSYAKGDPVPVPDFVPLTYTIIFLIIALAFRNRKLAFRTVKTAYLVSDSLREAGPPSRALSVTLPTRLATET